MLCNPKSPLSPKSGSYFKGRRIFLLYTLIFILLGGIFRYIYKHYWKSEKSNRLVRFSTEEPVSKKASRLYASSAPNHHRKRHSKSAKIDHSLPSVILLLGIHASGKTEWANQYVERVCKTAIVIRSDDIRKGLTNTVQDHTKEDEVEASILVKFKEQIVLEKTIVIDDCEHNLTPQFRQKILGLIPSGTFNRVVKCFPLKPIFATERILKDTKEGKEHYVPTDLELERLAAQFSEAEEAVKNEGWIEVKD